MSEHPEPRLQAIPPSREAFDWLGSFGDHQVEESIRRMGQRVREIVPDCVAVSLTVAEGELTFTLMADRPGAGLLDAMQYLDGGPCEAAVTEGTRRTTSNLATDEGEWQLFARAEAVTGITSTLSLPVMSSGSVVGGVNLYASSPQAFDGHHDEIAEACGAWAEGAVTNADLSFASQIRASATPNRLQEREVMDVATGFVAGHKDIATTEAASLIRKAAARAGVTEADFARFVLEAHTPHGDPRGGPPAE